jgi:phage/plasmid primase-like uncharacterized protein
MRKENGVALLSPTDLAARLELKKHPRSWRGACPSCGYSGAFSLRTGKENRALLYCSNGCSQEALAETLARVADHAWEPPQQETEDAEAVRKKKRASARRLWHRSQTLIGTLAHRYLAQRGLDASAPSPALRFLQEASHPEGCKLPALIACVLDSAGTIIGAHRTYLDATTAGKAQVEPPKASLGPIWSGAIRLNPVAEEIVIGEGIESSASAGLLMNLPAWAALSAGNLARGLILPPEVRSIVIAADADPVGQNAAWRAAARWRAEGRTARVATPDQYPDFNDLLRARMSAMEAIHG